MARALPLPRALAVLAHALAFACACNSDEPLDTTTEIVVTSSGYDTEPVEFTTGEIVEETTGDPSPGDQTCRGAMGCLIQCYMDLPDPPGPEQDFSCFFECGTEMGTEEWLALIRHATCVVDDCYARKICSDHGENDDVNCQGCIVTGLYSKPPVAACEAEGLACK